MLELGSNSDEQLSSVIFDEEEAIETTYLNFLSYQSFLYLLRALVQIDAVAIWLRVVVLPTVNKASKEQITIFLLVLCAIYCTVYK